MRASRCTVMRPTFTVSTGARARLLASTVLSSVLVLTTLSASSVAVAQPAVLSVAELAPKTRSDDPRVRAAAVLQLGATNDDAAVDPLCRSLSDTAEVVRISAASALRRLNRAAGVTCLKSRLVVESADGPKLQMSRALQALEASATPAAPAPAPAAYAPPSHANAKYYVALSNVTTTAERPQADVEAVVLKAVRAKLETSGDFQLAPMKETADGAKKALAGKKMKGFYLSISVEKFDYSGGNLRVKVNIAIFSYPGKALIAPSGKSASMSGVTPGDRNAEDQLLTAVAGAAAKQFADSASSM
jgi:hypothetical protein